MTNLYAAFIKSNSYSVRYITTANIDADQLKPWLFLTFLISPRSWLCFILAKYLLTINCWPVQGHYTLGLWLWKKWFNNDHLLNCGIFEKLTITFESLLHSWNSTHSKYVLRVELTEEEHLSLPITAQPTIPEMVPRALQRNGLWKLRYCRQNWYTMTDLIAESVTNSKLMFDIQHVARFPLCGSSKPL